MKNTYFDKYALNLNIDSKVNTIFVASCDVTCQVFSDACFKELNFNIWKPFIISLMSHRKYIFGVNINETNMIMISFLEFIKLEYII